MTEPKAVILNEVRNLNAHTPDGPQGPTLHTWIKPPCFGVFILVSMQPAKEGPFQ